MGQAAVRVGGQLCFRTYEQRNRSPSSLLWGPPTMEPAAIKDRVVSVAGTSEQMEQAAVKVGVELYFRALPTMEPADIQVRAILFFFRWNSKLIERAAIKDGAPPVSRASELGDR